MKKNFKLFLLAGLALVGLTGCTNKSMKAAYDKMQVNDNMNGYTVDYRLYGSYNNKNVDDVVRIENYMNKQFNISITDFNRNVDKFNKEMTPDVTDETDETEATDPEVTEEEEKNNNLMSNTNTELIYSDGVLYEDTNKGYVKSEKTTNYTSTDVYLKGLLKTSKVTQVDSEKIGDKDCSVYEIKVSKSAINDMVKNTSVSDFKADKDVNAKVWIDPDGYVYKVEYYLIDSDNNGNGLTLNIMFFGINTSREITLPSNM